MSQFQSLTDIQLNCNRVLLIINHVKHKRSQRIVKLRGVSEAILREIGKTPFPSEPYTAYSLRRVTKFYFKLNCVPNSATSYLLGWGISVVQEDKQLWVHSNGHHATLYKYFILFLISTHKITQHRRALSCYELYET